jgi:hypothetical protein
VFNLYRLFHIVTEFFNRLYRLIHLSVEAFNPPFYLVLEADNPLPCTDSIINYFSYKLRDLLREIGREVLSEFVVFKAINERCKRL